MKYNLQIRGSKKEISIACHYQRNKDITKFLRQIAKTIEDHGMTDSFEYLIGSDLVAEWKFIK